jgi:hypothetical protein
MANAPDNTGRKQTGAQPWKPGQSGNPAGRPKSARSRISEAFLDALANDFAEHGVETIARVRNEKPDQYLKVIAGLLPKDINIRTNDLDALSDDELLNRIRELDEALKETITEQTHRSPQRAICGIEYAEAWEP